MGVDGRVLRTGTVPIAPATDEPRRWRFRGPASTENACVRRLTAPVSREEREKWSIHEALTDGKPLIAKLETLKVPPRPNGWVHGFAEITGIALMGAGAVMAFFWLGFGILTAVAGPVVTIGSFVLHNRAAERRSRLEGEKHHAEMALHRINPATDEVSRMLKVSVKTIELVRAMPLEMEIKENMLRALAGRQDSEKMAERAHNLLQRVKARGEDLDVYSRNVLPTLFETLDRMDALVTGANMAIGRGDRADARAKYAEAAVLAQSVSDPEMAEDFRCFPLSGEA